ncbi:MAG: hypothetical protein WEB05_01860 [Solirubrobacterales bacterium]
MHFLTIPSTSASRTKALALGLLAAAAASLSLVSAASAQSVAIYSNSLKSANGRDQIIKKGPGTCTRGGSAVALRFTAGKRTKACNFAVPVVGRDIELGATGRIFKSVPAKLKKSIFLALNLRHASDGSQYQLAVFPSGRRFQIRKTFPNGSTIVLKAGRDVPSIRDFGGANRMGLRAYNGVSDLPTSTARLVAYVNGKMVGVVDDERGSELKGRDSSFSIASARNATGTTGSFNDVVVRIPSPF